ncbi:MAG: LytTR family transcriptional regulator [Paludibacteraceae bacterium]|nr:LytTR family transcriptional regulator [Paludibacteraceae bacterium]MBP6284884.1 LytTR family transcriptional regulator [Paludibacteraceae bacterium]
MHSIIPPYIYEKTNLTRLVIFTSIFSLLFINLFQPFGSREWYPNVSSTSYFFFSSLIILTGMLVVVVSRIIMYWYTKKHPIRYWQYGVWILLEILSMSLFYALFSAYIPKQGIEREFGAIFQQAMTNTSLVLLLPYSILWLYFSWRDKNSQLEKINNEEPNNEGQKKAPILFYDEKGELKISIVQENVLYIESSDNYVTIHYLNKSRISNFLLRNSLKWMDEHLTSETAMVRCHRSYIVNLDKVKVFRKTKDGIFLELDTLQTPDIPVSKTYYEKVMKKFSHYSV